LAYEVIGADGSRIGNATVFQTGSTVDINGYPTTAQAGTATVIVYGYNPQITIGSFTLTYTTDITGTLTSGVAKSVKVTVPGEQTAYTFHAVSGRHFTVAITAATLTNAGNAGGQLAYEVIGADGSRIGNATVFQTGSTVDINGYPNTAQAGTATVIVYGYNPQITIGSFTLVYTTDITGPLTDGAATPTTIKTPGQQTSYTFTAVAGQQFTVAITGASLTNAGNPGGQLAYEVIGADGSRIGNVTVFQSGSTVNLTATPNAAQAGTATAIVYGYNPQITIGTFTLTYTSP
jgi:hypothetical protein